MRQLWFASALLILSSAAHTQPALPHRADTTFTLQEEDDSLVSTKLRSDRGYTNGTRMLWSWQPTAGTRIARLGAMLCGHDSTCENRATAGLGQNMYTPENLRSPVAIRGDRPYGGWLYGALMLDATRPATNDHFEVYVGVIGRDSHADDAQIFVHKHVTPQAPDPLGWDTQIGEWPAFLAAYERRVKLLPRRVRADRMQWFDVTPAVGGAAGNVFVNVSASTTVRLGYNLPPHFIEPIRATTMALRTQLPIERSAAAPETARAAAQERKWDAFVYVVANAGYAARNVFLDSNDQQYRIEREPRVREHRAGVSFRVRRYRFAYQYTWRSSEFDSLVRRLRQPGREHSYGMIMFSVGPNP
jgi:hypothetical protein